MSSSLALSAVSAAEARPSGFAAGFAAGRAEQAASRTAKTACEHAFRARPEACVCVDWPNIFPVPILRIDHVQLAMPAGAEAEPRAFYAGLLGIPESAKPSRNCCSAWSAPRSR